MNLYLPKMENELCATVVNKDSAMSRFFYRSFSKKKLVLIIALLFNVYNSHAQNAKGTGQQKPVKITGLLAVNLMFFDTAAAHANVEKCASLLLNSHTVGKCASPVTRNRSL